MVESKFQTSFIPKKPIESVSTRERRPHSSGLFRMIAVILLLITLATWGGLYLWKFYLTQKIQGDTASLAASEKEFELGTVNTLVRLDNRLTASQSILNNHLAISKLFNELSQMTLKNVEFNDFALSYAGSSKGLTLTLKGQAIDYANVAKQSDQFSQNRDFQSPIFSDLNLDSNGRIDFTISTSLDPKNFIYSAGQPATPANAATTSAVSPFTQ